ncbi:hypothetical protein W97_04294 [Coniosporium apollinis CBS 100218]|uniref:NADAR domain-containing protein n=1 Tax=Coniosporium apollinis (strain CBS 100218) TaxID=1168221 RepID=R7YTA5_CONA1|nr:uncharacterized protein W97_04294 [Coniosporium apollinis CBS 100218]EON65059.1 hypothetical protein W97_04294 [Coniosporium apollinis CBS 100218]
MAVNLPPELKRAAELPPMVTDQYVFFFFGYEGPVPEVCFQQWYPSPIYDTSDKGEHLSFPTSDHYMMYHKALLMGDTTVAAKILAAPHPSEAKALGRQVSNFDEAKWMEKCDAIVTRGNYLKFRQSERLRLILLNTGDREIVETSPNDRFWGIGFDTENAENNVGKWGENRSGKALMKVREMLRG